MENLYKLEKFAISYQSLKNCKMRKKYKILKVSKFIKLNKIQKIWKFWKNGGKKCVNSLSWNSNFEKKGSDPKPTLHYSI